MNHKAFLFFTLWCFSVHLSVEISPALKFVVGEKHPLIPLAQQVLQTAYQRMGIDIEVKELPGARATSLLQYGSLDGELFRSIKVETQVENAIRIPVAIASGRIRAFSLNKDIQINGWKSLKGYRVGGLIRIQDIMPQDELLQFTPIKTPELLFKMLIRGRIDVVVAPEMLGTLFITKLSIPDVVMLNPAIQEDKLYHYLSDKHADKVPELTKILKAMEENGEIELITQQIENSKMNDKINKPL